jgi:hypothetical protein
MILIIGIALWIVASIVKVLFFSNSSTKVSEKEQIHLEQETSKEGEESKEEKKDEWERKQKWHLDDTTDRMFSKKWISSQLPYTKGNHFWLVDRKDLINGNLSKNSIEIVRDISKKKVTIRYWDHDRIDGVESVFLGNEKKVLISKFIKGQNIEISDEEELEKLSNFAESLFRFYSSASPYVKSLEIEKCFL